MSDGKKFLGLTNESYIMIDNHNMIKPTIEKAEKEESHLDIDALVKEALATEEIIYIK